MSALNNIFDIKHHSASTINSFIGYRHEWYLKKIRGVAFPGNHHMSRGKAVEEGINHYLKNECGVDECVKAALEVWGKEIIALGESFDMRQSIGKCVAAGIDSFRERGYDDGGTSMQDKISVVLPGCELPTIGYLDYLRQDRIVDNKCVSKTPTLNKVTKRYKHKQDYIIQGAIYKLATGLDPYFHYIIPLKDSVNIVEEGITEEDYDWGIKLAAKAAQAIERIIANPIDGDLFEAMMFPNVDAIYEGAQLNITLKEFDL